MTNPALRALRWVPAWASAAALGGWALVGSGCLLDATIPGVDLGGAGGGGGSAGAAGAGGAPGVCGDGELSGAELCDGELASVSCASYGLIGALSCTATCEVDKTTCSGCGNDQIDDIEECDGADLGDQTCLGQGTLTCTDLCTIDRSQCFVCGDGVLAGPEECDDSNTISGDGCDTDCVIEQPTGCELTGFYAPATFAAFGIDGTVDGAPAATAKPLCALVNGATAIYGFRPAVAGFVTVWLERGVAESPAIPAVLSLRSSCADATTELACHDSELPANGFFDSGGDVVSAYVQANTMVYALVQSVADLDPKDFRLQVSLAAGTCDDPVPIPIWPGGPTTVRGVTTGTGASCAGSGTDGPRVVYQVTRKSPGTIAAKLAPKGFDGVLELRSTCDVVGSCANASGPDGTEALSVNGVGAGESKLILVSAPGPLASEGVFALSLGDMAFAP